MQDGKDIIGFNMNMNSVINYTLRVKDYKMADFYLKELYENNKYSENKYSNMMRIRSDLQVGK